MDDTRNKEFAQGLNRLIEDFIYLGVKRGYVATLLELKASELRDQK